VIARRSSGEDNSDGGIGHPLSAQQEREDDWNNPRADGDSQKIAQMVVVGATMGLFEPDKYRTKTKSCAKSMR